MRSPVNMFADLEVHLRRLAEIKARCTDGAVSPEDVARVGEEMQDAVTGACSAYAELSKHTSALEDLRDILVFSYGGEADL